MSKRSAPSVGYDAGVKRHYRRTVWRTLRLACPVPLRSARVLLMPSLEGDEVEVVLNQGFREENLVLCDKNPAIVATLKRRFRKVETVGLELGRVAERVGDIDVANLDLCSCANAKLVAQLKGASLSLKATAAVAVTMLRGREPNWPLVVATSLGTINRWSSSDPDFKDPTFARLGDSDKARHLVALAGLHQGRGDRQEIEVSSLRVFTYKSPSGVSTMMVSVFGFIHASLLAGPGGPKPPDPLFWRGYDICKRWAALREKETVRAAS